MKKEQQIIVDVFIVPVANTYDAKTDTSEVKLSYYIREASKRTLEVLQYTKKFKEIISQIISTQAQNETADSESFAVSIGSEKHFLNHFKINTNLQVIK